MDSSMQIKINPKILIWAREERGMRAEEVADELGLEVSKLVKWETDGENVPFDVLQLVAKIYKRQTAIFFLPEVPPKTQKIKDCRNLARNIGHFSPDTLLAIRRTSRYLQVAREISDISYWNEQYKWVKDFDGGQERVFEETMLLRRMLDAPLDEQIKQQRSDAAFRYWRGRIEEKLGIFVFQFPMPEDELDGFSYAFDEFPYAIVVNNRNPSVRKIFTLFHELVHILKHDPGVCLTNVDSTAEKQLKIELECNNFAGKFLVPSKSVKVTNSIDKIFEFAGLFNVSGEVYLRRLFDEEKIKRNEFFSLLEDVRERSRNFPRKKKEGSPSMIIQSKSTRGNKLFNLVTNSAITNKISFSAASDLLGLKVGSIRS